MRVPVVCLAFFWIVNMMCCFCEQHTALPGVKSGELKSHTTRNEFKTWMVTFSQDGQQWCAATSHGLFTFTVNANVRN